MAKGYSKELVGVRDGSVVPALKADGRKVLSRRRETLATFDLSQSTVAKASGDTNVIGVLPKGHRFAGVRITSSVSLGTATIAIGYAGAPAAYRAAAVFTAVETPTTAAPTAALTADPVDSDTEIFFTVGTAALPSSGILVMELHYTGR
ncbi:hypothetical protein [Sphingomonas trueperi]|uniref:Uncharacterized protein n=1 Tax=Sphingomonas trueperi TaxID=53317 RepID=A0A7X5Y2L3_9SPHN|nr:hypothetical protein [Sphingomonas trueperi]NJB99869.1 hypothetical protein [Sphingomonas trueperi]